jgi:hypothetical protein
MTLKHRIQAFVQIGLFIEDYFIKQIKPNHQKFHSDLNNIIDISHQYNGWFTPDNTIRALKGISVMLKEEDLNNFTNDIIDPKQTKTVAIIMAGNIPAVGFHDLMCVLLCGHDVLIKASSDDTVLITFLAGMLIYFEPNFAPKINFSDGRLTNFNAVIATGSNNSAKNFEYYFNKYPHIIRKNRSSVAILNGKETKKELSELGKDIFFYYGLGCRNVSKLFVPEGYNFNHLFESVFDFKFVIDNKKYHNNYEYNRAIYLLDLVPFLDNNFLLITENKSLHAPTSVLFYEYYSNQSKLIENIFQIKDQIQCIASNLKIEGLKTVSFGKTQEPKIFEFADDVNTLNFLNNI